MFEEAIELLQNARKKLNNDNLFQYELARLYGWYRNYRESAAEYLKIVLHDPKSYPIVEKEIMSLPDDSATVQQVLEVLSSKTEADPQNVQFLQLKANYYLRHTRYESAFQSFIDLDKVVNAGGMRVLQLANALFQQGAYFVAARAYNYVIENYPANDQIGTAEFGLAHSYERTGFDGEDFQQYSLEFTSPPESGERTANLNRAIDHYLKIIEKNSSNRWGQNAYFRIGEIRFFTFIFMFRSAAGQKGFHIILKRP